MFGKIIYLGISLTSLGFGFLSVRAKDKKRAFFEFLGFLVFLILAIRA
jgi:hypothetical protein